MDRPEVLYVCKGCKKEMDVLGVDEDGFWWVHCMNDKCKQYGKNSIITANINNQKEIADYWLFSKFAEDDWRKKDAQAWLDSIWHEYNQYLYDNQ